MRPVDLSLHFLSSLIGEERDARLEGYLTANRNEPFETPSKDGSSG